MSTRVLVVKPLGRWSAWWRRGAWAHAAWLLADPAWAPLGYAAYDADGGRAAVLASATTGVVFRDDWHGGVSVLLARRTQADTLPNEAGFEEGAEPHGAFDLAWLVALREPSTANAIWAANARGDRRGAKGALGAALRRHAAPVLRGDFAVFAALQSLYAGLGAAADPVRARGLVDVPGRELTARGARQEAVVAGVRERFAAVLAAGDPPA